MAVEKTRSDCELTVMVILWVSFMSTHGIVACDARGVVEDLIEPIFGVPMCKNTSFAAFNPVSLPAERL